MAVSFHPSPRRILVRGVNWLGDAVMTTPALLRLREKFPEARIVLLTAEKLREMWQHHPAVDEVVTFTAEEGVLAVGRKLRAGKFELALVLPNSPRSALEVFFAGIPQRIGYARSWRNWFLTRALPTRPAHLRMHKRSGAEIQSLLREPNLANSFRPPVSAHQAFEYLHLVGALGAKQELLPPQLAVTDAEMTAAVVKFGLTGSRSAGQVLLGLNPGAEYGPAKRWPAERFVAAALALPAQTRSQWIIFGGRGDTELAGSIARRIPGSICVAGQTSLRELMALFRVCRAVLTNDTGPMHVAAAVGTPVVVPFGSTSPELTGPGLPGASQPQLLKSDAPCSPCFLRECPIDFRCMTGISVERVVAALQAALLRQ